MLLTLLFANQKSFFPPFLISLSKISSFNFFFSFFAINNFFFWIFFFPWFLVFVQHKSFKQLSNTVNLIGLSWNQIHAKKFSLAFATKYLGACFGPLFSYWSVILLWCFFFFFSRWISHLCFSLMQNTFVIVWLPPLNLGYATIIFCHWLWRN